MQNGESLLHLAASHGKVEVVEVLLNDKADVSATDKVNQGIFLTEGWVRVRVVVVVIGGDYEYHEPVVPSTAATIGQGTEGYHDGVCLGLCLRRVRAMPLGDEAERAHKDMCMCLPLM